MPLLHQREIPATALCCLSSWPNLDLPTELAGRARHTTHLNQRFDNVAEAVTSERGGAPNGPSGFISVSLAG